MKIYCVFKELGCGIRNRRTTLIRYEYQTCLRLSNELKDDMTEVCERYKINESDLLRRAAANFIQELNSKPEQGKYLFV